MSKKLTTEEFITKSNIIHNNKYDYLKSIYKNNNTNIIIICPEHGEFNQKPKKHMSGQGCKKCADKRKTNNLQNFIEKSNIIHNNKYDYSLVEYINAYTKIKIICPIHGIFEQTPASHLKGHNCFYCYKDSLKSEFDEFIKRSNEKHNHKYDYSKANYINKKTKLKIICPIHGIFEETPQNHYKNNGCKKCEKINNQKIFIEKCNKIHNNKYDYSLVNYNGFKSNITIICPEHGKFKQLSDCHLRGHGCKKCADINKKLTTEEFIIKSNIIHNNKYDYSLVNYGNSSSKIKIICPLHGIFEQTSSEHLHGSGCPTCNDSKGERKISKYLSEHKIKFEKQMKFENCKNINLLPFDFYLPEQNICIEFDGRQHYEIIEYFGGEERLKYTQNNDQIKNNFCKNNNIQLIRIKFDEDINKILNNKINI
jgi:very-short-patch-repair endonuclease